jgi:hypothetical protein
MRGGLRPGAARGLCTGRAELKVNKKDAKQKPPLFNRNKLE